MARDGRASTPRVRHRRWRNFGAIAALVALLLAGSTPAARAEDDKPPAESAIKARIVTRPIKVDGVLTPEEWPDDPASTARLDSAEQCQAESRPRWKGPEDASAVVRIAADADAIYLGATIRDDVAFHPGEPWWHGDSLELFLNTDLAGSAAPGEDGKPPADVYTDSDWQIFLMPANPNLRWGVAIHGRAVRFDDGGLIGVQVASVPGRGGSYDIEARIPLSNFPGLSGGAAKSLGFALALNDVDRVTADAAGAGSRPDPGTYLSWNRGFELYRKPGNFGRLDLPGRSPTPIPSSTQEPPASPVLWVALAVAVLLAITLVGPGSKRLARSRPRAKVIALALDLLLAGFLAAGTSCQDKTARAEARDRIDAAAREAEAVASEAAELGALDPADPAARARAMLRLLAGESVPCVPPVAAAAYVSLSEAWQGTAVTAPIAYRIPLSGGVEADWPLAAPTPAAALLVRIDPARDVGEARRLGPGRSRLGVLRATTTDGGHEDLPVETDLSDGAGERSIRVALPRAGTLVRLRYRHEEGAPAATLAGIVAIRADGSETTVLLPSLTEDRIPVLAQPGAVPGQPGGFLGAVVPPKEERTFALPELSGADRLWLVATAERAFPVTRHGQPVAEVEVRFSDGPPLRQTLQNGDDIDEERLIHAIKHPADMRSRVAYRWTDASGVLRHHDLVSIPLEGGRKPVALLVRNLGAATAEQGTGAFTLVAATLGRRVTDVKGGRLDVASGDPRGRDRVLLHDPKPFADVIRRQEGEVVKASVTVGPADRRATLTFVRALPPEVARRREATETALLTCLVLAAFFLVLLAVDAFQAFRRLAPRLVLGVLVAALVPIAVTIGLADRRNFTRLEEERETRARGWLVAARNAIVGSERQEAQVGAQGLLQLVTSLKDRADVARVRDQVSIYRSQGIVGGARAAVVVKGRDLPSVTIEPATIGARVDGASFLADRTDAPGLYASPWDGLLLVATARSVGEDDWRKVVVAVRIDDDFVAGRVAATIPDGEAEVAILTREGSIAGTSGPGGAALGRALSSRIDGLRAAGAAQDAMLLRRVATDDGPRLAVVTALSSAESPDAPAAWLAVGVARRSLDESLTSLREELVGLGLAAAVLVACVGAMLARRIAGPVRELVLVTNAMRRGEFDVVVPTGGTDEVGDLAVAFDQMRRDLKHRVGDLDFLRHAQEAVSASLDLGRTAQAGLDLFRERWSPPLSVLLMALSPTGPVTVKAEAGRKNASSDRPIAPLAEGWVLAALAAGTPLVVEDAANDPRVRAEGTAANRLLDDCNAWIAVPLRAGAEAQGLVVLAWPGAASLPSAEALSLLTPLSGVVALAVHNARLYRLAALDEATTLPGATAFESSLRRDVEAALAGGPAAVVLRVGLDGLERVGRQRSVEASRSLLRAAADALRSALEGRVQAGRLRKDELCVRVPGATREDAMALATRIRERVSAVEIRPEDGGDAIRTGVSIGIARCPEDATSVEFLLDAAGRALAAARRDGGDRVEDVRRVDQALAGVPPFEDGAVFRTESMVRVLETARRVSRTDSTVLLTGETGVGKEVIADLIHRRSLRATGAFVKVNTAAFPESLLESELFGHEKGAFTGAEKRREGRFELADKGTLFLDEVAEMTREAQVRLLRVLAEGQFTRLGGTKPVDVDVRVIAATNRDLEKDVREGRFREDLYYRLNVLRIEIPPLRERREEIPSLVEHFLVDARRRLGRGPERLSPLAMDALYRHPWPGNVRELRNVIERTAVMCEDDVAGPEHLRLDPPRGSAAFAGVPVAAPLDSLNERQRRLLDHLSAHGRCTNRQFIEMTSASARTGLRDLQELMDKGFIVREGKRRGAVYRLP